MMMVVTMAFARLLRMKQQGKTVSLYTIEEGISEVE